MSKRDYYEILGVDKGANEKTMKSAFRKKAMGCHPDRHPDDPEAEARFKELNEAYGILSCLLYTSPSPRDRQKSRMPSSA